MNNLINSINDIKFNYRDKLNFEKKYKFGIEIEFENASYYDVEQALLINKDLKKWDLHHEPTVEQDEDDISLGGEVVSPVLNNTKSAWINIEKACNLLKKMNAKIVEYSGAHIHIDENIISGNENYILNLLKLWTIYEHVIYKFSYGEFDIGRKYLCCYAYNMATLLDKFIKCYRHSETANIYRNVMLFCDTYYSSLKGGLWFADCKGVDGARHNTIEIRCPNGTLNEVIWQNNINFFIHLLKVCSSQNLNIDFLNYKFEKYQDIYNYNGIYLDDALELSNIIYDDDIDKIYFLKQYVKKIK